MGSSSRTTVDEIRSLTSNVKGRSDITTTNEEEYNLGKHTSTLQVGDQTGILTNGSKVRVDGMTNNNYQCIGTKCPTSLGLQNLAVGYPCPPGAKYCRLSRL